MSNYLELLEAKSDLGIITNIYYEYHKKLYTGKRVKQNQKDKFDANAAKELALFKEDKNAFLTTKLISEVKAINNRVNSIKEWVTFFGIIFVLGLVITVISFAIQL